MASYAVGMYKKSMLLSSRSYFGCIWRYTDCDIHRPSTYPQYGVSGRLHRCVNTQAFGTPRSFEFPLGHAPVLITEEFGYLLRMSFIYSRMVRIPLRPLRACSFDFIAFTSYRLL